MRRPNNSKLSTKNWTIALQKIKNELNTNNHTSLFGLIQGNNINSLWGTFLLKSNIIYKQDNLYKWSENIDVTASLINRYRKFQSENSKKYSKNKNQEPNLFNMPQTPLPKPPKVRKTRIDSKYLSVNDIVEIYGKSESTIRRILDDAKQNGSVKEVPMKNGVKKIYISKDYLDSIFKAKVKVRFYDEPKSELGVIRKFLKWLW